MENPEYQESYSNHDDRTAATFAHLGILAGSFIPFGNIFLPLVIWLTQREKSEFLDDHGKEALNFQITMTIIFIGSAILCFVLIGFILLPVAFILYLVLSIMAAVKANQGEFYEYPFNFRFIQ